MGSNMSFTVLPLDITGNAASNLITNEAYACPSLATRIFPLNAGPFYTRGLVVRNGATGVLLQPNTQYLAIQLDRDLSAHCSESVTWLLLIKDQTINSVTVTYQAVGGDNSVTGATVLAALAALPNSGSAIATWNHIIDEPYQFMPLPHQMRADTGVYGFNEIKLEIQAIMQAIQTGDGAMWTQVFQYVQQYGEDIMADLANLVPTGSTFMHAGISPPAGSIKANGAAISRTAYAPLFAVIGTAFGAGDGSTTFNVPDLRGKFARGWDDSRGIDTGRVFGSDQGDAIGTHNHYLPTATGSHGSPVWNLGDYNPTGNSPFAYSDANRDVASPPYNYGSNSITTYPINAPADPPTTDYTATGDLGNWAAETRPTNTALLACIKY
jgi:hypothetical protein